MSLRFLALGLFAFGSLLGCSSTAASVDAGQDAEEELVFACDPRMVACRLLPPTCPTGFTASVDGSCWGECVQSTSCAPIACTDTAGQCPQDWGCAAAMCAPPR